VLHVPLSFSTVEFRFPTADAINAAYLSRPVCVSQSLILHVLAKRTPDISLFGQSCKQIVSMFACTSLSEGEAAVPAGR